MKRINKKIGMLIVFCMAAIIGFGGIAIASDTQSTTRRLVFSRFINYKGEYLELDREGSQLVLVTRDGACQGCSLMEVERNLEEGMLSYKVEKNNKMEETIIMPKLFVEEESVTPRINVDEGDGIFDFTIFSSDNILKVEGKDLVVIMANKKTGEVLPSSFDLFVDDQKMQLATRDIYFDETGEIQGVYLIFYGITVEEIKKHDIEIEVHKILTPYTATQYEFINY